ncbi:MAG: hypothetical protein OER86_02505 [Phycisphaerae bacterium]|nr:hypothetical protein [Phycisphaerae bacterium]
MSQTPCILFTAFEPSGDEHAAPVIGELRRRRPDLPVYALGGPKMAEAGAELIETTTDKATMLAGSFAQAWAHHRRLGRLRKWLADHPVAVHVPTDSPAANWSICRLVKRTWGDSGARVVHLVAPQVWAWATWRVRRLRKWSDLVLCILPFEPQWFAKHDVPSRFVGHPMFDEELDLEALGRAAANFPADHPRIALLPGSRRGEVKHNWPLMEAAFHDLVQRYPHAQGLIAAADERMAAVVREQSPALAANLQARVGETEAILHWSDVVITVSGTATLHVARHHKPMVILFVASAITWNLIGRFLVSTRTFTLPNLLSSGGPRPDDSGHVVKEFAPFFGGVGGIAPIVEEVASLIDDEAKRQNQIRALIRVMAQFDEHRAAPEAASAILQVLDGTFGPGPTPAT